MTAAITSSFKNSLLTALSDAVNDADDNYYIGIGRAHDWNDSDVAPIRDLEGDSDISSISFLNKVRNSLQSYKIVESNSLVLPRVNWVSNTIYYPYTDTATEVDVSTNPYYVMNQNLRVYICLEQPKDTSGNPQVSTVEPTGVQTASFKTADGYVWKYMYQIGPEDANNHMTNNYIPVQYIKGAGVTAVEVEQKSIQDSAVAGAILSIEILDGGTGYINPVTVNILGSGTDAAASVNNNGGILTHVTMNEVSGVIQHGSGYKDVTISFVGNGGGSGAKARAVIGPVSGITADPTVSLRADSLMFHSDFVNSENDTILTDNDFRQSTLIKNPKKYGSLLDSDFTANAGNALFKLNFSDIVNPFNLDEEITGQTSQAKALVAYYDGTSTPKQVWFYQTEETGFVDFNAGEQILSNSGGEGTLQSSNHLVDPDVDTKTGEILYINNFTGISRDPAQTEDVKLVVKL